MDKQKVRYLISLMGYLFVRLTKYPYPGDVKIYQLALQQSDKQVLCKFPFTNQQKFFVDESTLLVSL